MPRRRPSRLRAEAQQHRLLPVSLSRPKVGGARLSGSARAAVLRYERAHGFLRGMLLLSLAVWCRATAVVAPPVDDCGEWECCGYNRPCAQSRDILDDLVRTVPPGPARELRRLIRQADRRIVGDDDGPWWRDPLLWR